MPQDSFRYSIIIPHYNSSDTLIKLLESIPARADIQIVIVDDNSTTDISEAGDYIAARSQCEFYVNDTGIQSAGVCRNIGLSHATGKWILFADADDYFTEGFVDVIERWYDTGHDFILFIPTSVDITTGEPTNRHLRHERFIREYQRSPDRRNELRIRYLLNPPWSKMIRRSYLVTHQISFEPVPVANDVLFSTKLSYHASSIAAEGETIYVVTKSGGSLQYAVTMDRFLVRREVFIRNYLFLQRVLSEDDWELLGIDGEWYLAIIMKNRLGIGLLRETHELFRANNIKPPPQYSIIYKDAYRRFMKRLRDIKKRAINGLVQVFYHHPPL